MLKYMVALEFKIDRSLPISFDKFRRLMTCLLYPFAALWLGKAATVSPVLWPNPRSLSSGLIFGSAYFVIAFRVSEKTCPTILSSSPNQFAACNTNR